MSEVNATPNVPTTPGPSRGEIFKVTDKNTRKVEYCLLTHSFQESNNYRLVYLHNGMSWFKHGTAKYVTTSCEYFLIEKFEGKIELICD